MELKLISLKVPVGVLERIDAAAAKAGLTRTAVLLGPWVGPHPSSEEARGVFKGSELRPRADKRVKIPTDYAGLPVVSDAAVPPGEVHVVVGGVLNKIMNAASPRVLFTETPSGARRTKLANGKLAVVGDWRMFPRVNALGQRSGEVRRQLRGWTGDGEEVWE